MSERNIYQVHGLINDIIRKERGAFVTDPQIDEWLNMGQWDVYKAYWREYLLTDVLPEPLEVFKKRFSFSFATSVGGLVDKPSDYQHFLNSYTVTYDNERGQIDYNECVPLNEDEIVIARRSQLRPISKQRPKIVQGGSVFVLYPQEPQAGYVNYLKTPATPFADITYVNRTPTYNANGSTQLEWRDANTNEIILAALSYIGINLNEQQLTAYAEQKEKE
jgi:hypothetical protein